MSAAFDCQRCGACCYNTELNRSRGRVFYIRIDEGDAILEQPARVEQMIVIGPDGAPYMRLDDVMERCVALDGTLGERVCCTVYDDRPTGCRIVQPGDEECMRARRDRGITEAP